MTTANTALGLVLRDLPALDVERIAGLAEQAGFTDIFFPESGHAAPWRITGRDPFVLAAAALRATKSLRAGPGVAATVVRPYYSMAIAAASLHEASSGRFVLGCGVSHPVAMRRRGEPYPSSPLTHAAEFLDKLTATRDQLTYGADFPVWLSALGPKMLELAATCSDGVMLNWMTSATAKSAIETFHASRPHAKPATTVLYLRTGAPDELRAEAEQYLRFDNYARHFDRQDLITIDEVTAGTCLPSDRESMLDAIAEYRGIGVDVPAVYPVGLSPEEICRLIERLAG
ncbi:LLM class flavin-dependent oxidoreductase [Saccharopolyspora sp. K220]|uniref:LLM class flavin-dependent oxidoreductase n=1 Tax=Saccharopolyspora soli TaxID=2926618 RepID=UPI001F59D3AD|nr:LLM class flavin-dependent oxidoreductase [Saccharopolyspora soli]MCI2419530.1 LLM class flavin-dependent oxidoreductase [Saccharopolyspora soli]